MNYLMLQEKHKAKIFDLLMGEEAKQAPYENMARVIKYIEDQYLGKIEKIKEKIEEKADQAEEEFKKNSKISVNAYGSGYEKGIYESMEDLLSDIEEIENETK